MAKIEIDVTSKEFNKFYANPNNCPVRYTYMNFTAFSSKHKLIITPTPASRKCLFIKLYDFWTNVQHVKALYKLLLTVMK